LEMIEITYQAALKKTDDMAIALALSPFAQKAAVVELCCHLSQKFKLSKYMAGEMDINLEVLNLETDFFGDLYCNSRWTDMFCDAQVQYQDYSVLELCPKWQQ